jgi:hypothetical protein
MRKNFAPAHMSRSNKVKMCRKEKLICPFKKKFEKVKFYLDYFK